MKNLKDLGFIPDETLVEIEKLAKQFMEYDTWRNTTYIQSISQRVALSLLIEEFMRLYESETDDYIPDYSGLYHKCRNAYGYDIEE